jgi:hypothetical protein
MGEIMLAGTTHYPLLLYTDDFMPAQMERHWKSDLVPPEWKDQNNWPAQMREEYGPDGANAMVSAAAHRERLVDGFRRVRDEIDAFQPDFVLIWGDDQYENFHEDLIPPFCIFVADQFETKPFERRAAWSQEAPTNIWNEPSDKVAVTKSHPAAAKYLARKLLEEGYAIPYSYRGLHHEGLAHAFMNTVNYLDYDRTDFGVPVIPFHVNCYGSAVIRNRGGDTLDKGGDEPDPPAPSPKLCFEVGAAVARILRDSPYRAVLMGSSSWSHAFLTAKHNFLWPDVEADRARYEDLRDGRQASWKDLDLAQIEDSGQHELLNWVCLAGAITELGYQAEVLDFSETYIFNSSKCSIVAKAAPATAAAG